MDLSHLLSAAASADDNDFNDKPTTTTIVTAELILDCRNVLGEGLLYDDERRMLLWTDILQNEFHSLDMKNPKAVEHTVYRDLPKKLCSFGMLAKQNDGDENNNADAADSDSLPLLCAWEDGFQIYDVMRGVAVGEYSAGEDVNPAKGSTRLNDGRTDPTGERFVCGGFHGGDAALTMKVYAVEQQQEQQQRKEGDSDNDNDNSDTASSFALRHYPILSDVKITNSICWSPDGNTMYHADSPEKRIDCYRYGKNNDTDDAEVSLSNRRVFHETLVENDGVSVPDGSTADAGGNVWNAVWREGAGPGVVQCIDPSGGKVAFEVKMPDATSQVTCCCFGGPFLDVLFITTASVGLTGEAADKERHAGGLYAVKLPNHAGRKESRLRFKY